MKPNEALRQAIESRGISIRKAARDSNVNPSNLCKVLNGRATLTPTFALRILAMNNLPADSVIEAFMAEVSEMAAAWKVHLAQRQEANNRILDRSGVGTTRSEWGSFPPIP